MITDITKRATLNAMYHFPSRASEWATAVILLNWSILAFLFDGKGFVIDHVNTWAFLFFILSATRIIILYVNGHLRLSPHYRSGLSFLSCFAWMQITLAIIAEDNSFNALAAFPVLLALDFYNAYHVAVEARITDEGYKNDRAS